MYANDEPSTILTNRINRFSAQWLGLCQKRPDQLALRQTAPKRVRRNRGQIRRFRELDGIDRIHIPYYLTYSTPSVISRPRLLVAVLLRKIRLLPAARMTVLSYKSCIMR